MSAGNSTFKEIVFSLSSRDAIHPCPELHWGCRVAQDIGVLITLALDRGEELKGGYRVLSRSSHGEAAAILGSPQKWWQWATPISELRVHGGWDIVLPFTRGSVRFK